MIELIGAPFDGCGRRQGASLGPAAVRLAGLADSLQALGLSVTDSGDVTVPPPVKRSGLNGFEAGFEVYRQLRSRVSDALGAGHVPLVIGGDHSMAIGTISGALERHGRKLAVLWIDAHADINTPSTSPSGNLHGMPVAALLRIPEDSQGMVAMQWSKLLQSIVPDVALSQERMAYFGLRDVDPAEAARVRDMPSAYVCTMYDVDRRGLPSQIELFDAWMRQSGATELWISFDVDALDPILAPGTGTAVRGGLSYREMHLVAEMLCEQLRQGDCPYRLAGLDLVETNPIFDSNNETALMAVEWIGSLFGKTILGRRV